MTEKAARIVREYGNSRELRGGALEKFITAPRGALEIYFAEYLAGACADIIAETQALPELMKILPEEILATIKRAPEGQTLSSLEKVSMVILRNDARIALGSLTLETPADFLEFHTLKYQSFLDLMQSAEGVA
jgi:hypothetical protein